MSLQGCGAALNSHTRSVIHRFRCGLPRIPHKNKHILVCDYARQQPICVSRAKASRCLLEMHVYSWIVHYIEQILRGHAKNGVEARYDETTSPMFSCITLKTEELDAS
jgi:hypothetical protein